MLTQRVRYRKDVFIAAAAHIHDDEPVFAKLLGQIYGARDGVAGL